MNLSFCTTAMARPDIVERTYASFQKNLGIDLKSYRLCINVDPLPDVNKVAKVIDVAKSFFGEVVYRTPKSGNFTDAVRWCWENADSEFLFHLEDDWELRQKFPLATLLKEFTDDRVITVVLRAYKYKYDKIPLSPSIHRKKFYKAVKFDTSINPEIQLRNLGRFGVKFTPSIGLRVLPKNKTVVFDIGRAWMKKVNYCKPKKKSSFTTWIEK